jgi:hypothetical protein
MDCLIQRSKQSEQGTVQDAHPTSTMYSVLQYECNRGEGYWLRYLDFEQSIRFQVSMLASACRCSVSFLSQGVSS